MHGPCSTLYLGQFAKGHQPDHDIITQLHIQLVLSPDQVFFFIFFLFLFFFFLACLADLSKMESGHFYKELGPVDITLSVTSMFSFGAPKFASWLSVTVEPILLPWAIWLCDNIVIRSHNCLAQFYQWTCPDPIFRSDEVAGCTQKKWSGDETDVQACCLSLVSWPAGKTYRKFVW